ncbi:MAG: hotdog fold thioesterase [Candidatus Sericytochromatia bacterium]|nr:hotdog fold thioesterase [Candidatus Sericytochromatia bacterium]
MSSDPTLASDATALAAMQQASQGTLTDVLGIELLAVGRDLVRARMPVTRAVHQPFGLLHGGASVVLAETVASIGAWMNVDQQREIAVGLEINANHLRAVRDGSVSAEARPIHRGRTTQVWEVHIRDAKDRLVCISRCTLAVSPKPAD